MDHLICKTCSKDLQEFLIKTLLLIPSFYINFGKYAHSDLHSAILLISINWVKNKTFDTFSRISEECTDQLQARYIDLTL